MGQGSYVALMFGTKLTKAQEKKRGKVTRQETYKGDDGKEAAYDVYLHEDIGEAAVKARVKTPRGAYECEDSYLGYRIAASSGVGPLDLDVGAVPISKLEAWARKKYAPKIKAARENWNAYVKVCAGFGLVLPEGELMLVADYD